MGLPAWAWTFIAVSVTITWVILNAIDAASQSYAVDPGLHIVMGSVAGATGASGYAASKRNGGGDDRG